MDSEMIRMHSQKINPIYELTAEQIAMIDEVCKPFINEDSKFNIDNAIICVSSTNKSKSQNLCLKGDK